MEASTSKKPTGRIALIAFLVLAVGGLGFWATRLLNRSAAFSTQQWVGVWEVNYFYENNPAHLFTGSLHLSYEDSLSGYLEVFPPKSIRPESLALEQLTLSKDATQLSGHMVHKRYRINGGHMRESFELSLDEPGKLSGQGQCLAYCAEGTLGLGMEWSGEKMEE